MNRNKLTSAVLCTAMLLCLAACSRPEPQPVSSDMTSGTAAAETSSECLISSAGSETNSAFLSEPVQTAENNSTVSSVSSSKANASAVSSTSASPSKPKPPTASSAPSKPPAPVSSAPPTAESSAPQEPDEPEPEPPEEKGPYAYPFDIEAIRQDLIEYGERLGMKHITEWEYDTFDADGNLIHVKEDITPENSSWAIPSVISREWKADEVKKELFEYLEYDFNKYHMTSFTIFAQPLNDGAYQIYVLR